VEAIFRAASSDSLLDAKAAALTPYELTMLGTESDVTCSMGDDATGEDSREPLVLSDRRTKHDGSCLNNDNEHYDSSNKNVDAINGSDSKHTCHLLIRDDDRASADEDSASAAVVIWDGFLDGHVGTADDVSNDAENSERAVKIRSRISYENDINSETETDFEGSSGLYAASMIEVNDERDIVSENSVLDHSRSLVETSSTAVSADGVHFEVLNEFNSDSNIESGFEPFSFESIQQRESFSLSSNGHASNAAEFVGAESSRSKSDKFDSTTLKSAVRGILGVVENKLV